MLGQQNANRPKGQIGDEETTSDLATNDQLLKAEQYRPLIVSYSNGAAVRLSDIADVQDSVENLQSQDGKRQAVRSARDLPRARRQIIDTVDGVRKASRS